MYHNVFIKIVNRTHEHNVHQKRTVALHTCTLIHPSMEIIVQEMPSNHRGATGANCNTYTYSTFQITYYLIHVKYQIKIAVSIIIFIDFIQLNHNVMLQRLAITKLVK